MANKTEPNKAELRSVSVAEPYALPDGWKWTRLGDYLDIRDGTHDSPKYVENGYPFVTSKNLVDGNIDFSNVKYISEKDHKNFIQRSFVEDNDILFAMIGSIGNPVLVKKDREFSIKNVALFKPRDKEHTNMSYVYFYLMNLQDSLKAKTKGGMQPFIPLSLFRKELFIPLPNLAEQQRIVSRIESMFAKLDEAANKAQTVLDGFETRKAAILHKAFTGELTAKWRKEHGVSDDSWEEKTLGECGTVFGGGTPSMGHKEYWENGNILWITSKDMKSDLIEKSEMYTNMTGVENSSAKYIENPAVLFVIRSGILRRTFPVCMVKKPFTVNQDLKALVPNDFIMLEYIFYACKCNERKILDTCMKNGTTVESINAPALFNVKIKVPTLPEQQEIVRILNSVLEKESAAKAAAKRVLEQIALLKKSILARAFRGEL